jgi:SAM-dependent methyltransferase
MLKNIMDNIYKEIQSGNVPWNNENPPDLLVNLVDSKTIKPCKAVDLGCGAGNYTIYLASMGFEMTGIDLSDEAINIAKKNAFNKNFTCSFISGDITEDAEIVKDKFKFAFDYEVLHHVFPDKRNKYVNNVYNLLEPDSFYMSVCFSEKDESFGGKEKFRKTPLGTELYFSSEDELYKLYRPLFNIIELKTIDLIGHNNHKAVYALLLK